MFVPAFFKPPYKAKEKSKGQNRKELVETHMLASIYVLKHMRLTGAFFG